MRRGRVRWAKKKNTYKLIKKQGGTLEFLHSKKKHQQQQQHVDDPQVFKNTHAYKRNGEKDTNTYKSFDTENDYTIWEAE